MARALSAGNTLTTALAGGPARATPFPASNSLADPLRMVAPNLVNWNAARRNLGFV